MKVPKARSSEARSTLQNNLTGDAYPFGYNLNDLETEANKLKPAITECASPALSIAYTEMLDAIKSAKIHVKDGNARWASDASIDSAIKYMAILQEIAKVRGDGRHEHPVCEFIRQVHRERPGARKKDNIEEAWGRLERSTGEKFPKINIHSFQTRYAKIIGKIQF